MSRPSSFVVNWFQIVSNFPLAFWRPPGPQGLSASAAHLAPRRLKTRCVCLEPLPFVWAHFVSFSVNMLFAPGKSVSSAVGWGVPRVTEAHGARSSMSLPVCRCHGAISHRARQGFHSSCASDNDCLTISLTTSAFRVMSFSWT